MTEKIMEYQFDQLSHLEKQVIEKLENYRSARSEIKINEVFASLQKFEQNLKLASSFHGFCGITPHTGDIMEVQRIYEIYQRVKAQLPGIPVRSIGETVHYIYIVCSRPMPYREEERKSVIDTLQSAMRQLPEDLQDFIYKKFFTYFLCTEKDKLWEMIKSDTDLDCFKSALCSAMRESTERILTKVYGLRDDSLVEFYKNLHHLALGPPIENPVGWAKSELPFLVDLVPAALKHLKGSPHSGS
jgi:hypothetical protein